MNEKNVAYLKDNLKYMGFGDKLNESLEAAVEDGKPDFQLKLIQQMHQGDLSAILHFRQSPSSGMYFFNSYQARLIKENGYDRSQHFYLNNGKGVTLKEAYNLLDGRSVLNDLTNKEGATYQAWLKIDFNQLKSENQYQVRQFHGEKYGFDLRAELGKLNLSPLTPEKEQQLLQSLQKGNRQAAYLIRDGKEELMFIEANPQFKTINVFDASGQYIDRSEKERYMNQEVSGVANGTRPSLVERAYPAHEQTVAEPGDSDKLREPAETVEKRRANRSSKTKKSRATSIKGLLPVSKRPSRKPIKIS